jgi:hypothetical protein
MFRDPQVALATCLWEADSVEAVQEYVDSTLGDSSEHKCYEVDAEMACSRQPRSARSRTSPPAARSTSQLRQRLGQRVVERESFGRPAQGENLANVGVRRNDHHELLLAPRYAPGEVEQQRDP